MTYVTKEVAAHVLHHFRGEGYAPGSFTTALITAFAKADPHNRARLDMAFPEYGEAMTMALNDRNGIAELRKILFAKT